MLKRGYFIVFVVIAFLLFSCVSVSSFNENIGEKNISLESLKNMNDSIITNKYHFIGVALILGIILILLLLKKIKSRLARSGIGKFAKAKEMVKDAKEMGYSNESIKQMFRDKNWKEEDINKLLGE